MKDKSPPPMEQLFITCECQSLDHLVVFDFDPVDKQIYLSVHLMPFNSFWKRLKNAIKYLFGYKRKYGDWEELLISPDKSKEIIKVLNQGTLSGTGRYAAIKE